MDTDEFLQAMASLKVDHASASGVVSVRVAHPGGIVVSLDPKLVRQTDEDVVAVEVEDAIRDALATFDTESKRIVEEYEDPSHEVDPDVAAEWRQSLAAAVESTEALGRSQHGLAEVFVFGDGEIFVKINQNAVRNTEISYMLVEQELNEAIKLAFTSYSRQENIARGEVSKHLFGCAQ
jgi:DNA-binding protein YbaB